MPAVEQDLTQGSVTRKLVRYALPLVASSLLQAIYSITDIIIAGHYIGDVGISAINNASIIMNMLTQLAIGLTVGGNVLVGQYFGSGDHENRRKAAGNMLTVGLIAGLLFAVGILLLGRPLLILLQSPTLEEATAYLSICGVGLLFIFVYNSLSAILRGVGNSRIPLYCIIASVSLNVVLDILFVAGVPMGGAGGAETAMRAGFHRGLAGAALATVIGQAISCLTALVFSLRHRADLGLLPRYLRPEAEMVKRTLKLGFPVALQWTIASISWLVVLTLINKYGVTVSAGNGVSNKIRDFCQLFLSALTTGAGTMCAQCLGAGLYDRAEQVMKTCMKLALAMAAVIIVVAEVFAPQFAMIFTPDPEVQHWAVVNLRIEIVCQLFYAGMFTYNTLATGSGHTVFIMWNSFLNCIVVRLILAVVLEHFLGIYGVYIACGVAVASSVPVGWWFYRSKRWMTMKNIH